MPLGGGENLCRPGQQVQNFVESYKQVSIYHVSQRIESLAHWHGMNRAFSSILNGWQRQNMENPNLIIEAILSIGEQISISTKIKMARWMRCENAQSYTLKTMFSVMNKLLPTTSFRWSANGPILVKIDTAKYGETVSIITYNGPQLQSRNSYPHLIWETRESIGV